MWSNHLRHVPVKSTGRMYRTVAECYKGKSVFITGGTGFLGKMLLEKLLYSCPGIDKIYLLVREKQGATAQERVHRMLEMPLFSRLKAENQQALQKIIPVAGDIAKPKLGIKAKDEELLTDKVSFVFHMAANVNFDERLEDAMKINFGGTVRTLNLTKGMRNIKAFVHVSTAYSNTDRKVIKELIYPPPASINEVKKLLANGISEEQVKEVLGKKPNTYTFTKALAENLVAEDHGDVPALIIRPSIVSPSNNEPVAGWIEKGFVATQLMKTCMKGRTRVLLARPDSVVDLIPADYVSNLCIVAAARCKSSKEVDVYNCCTSGENPILWKQIVEQVISESRKHKFYDLPMPMVNFTYSRRNMKLLSLFLQTLPAYIADLFLLITGNKNKHVEQQANVEALRARLEYFTSNSWVMSASRTRALSKSLLPSDRHLYPCDPADIDWNDYLPNAYCKGIRQYI